MTEKEGVFYELEVAKKDGANLLMPSTQIAGLSEFHAPVVEKVVLSSDPKDGDVYPHSSEDDENKQKFRLTKQALMKLSVCAGIIWSVAETKRLDNRSDRNYCAFAAVGGIKKADGQPVFFRAEYDIDFEVIEEELRESYEGKAKKYKKDADYVEFCVKRDMLQKRKHKLKLAEAGAMNRVVREILGLKNAYTKAELAKPFVMVRIVFRPDYNDKEVRKQLVAAHIQSMTGIYGKQVIDEAVRESEPIDITPIPGDKENGDTEPEEDIDPIEKQALDFSTCDSEERVKTLLSLAKLKGYNIQEYLKKANLASVSSIKTEKQVSFFKHLLMLPDKPVVVEQDVPF